MRAKKAKLNPGYHYSLIFSHIAIIALASLCNGPMDDERELNE
ncbi:MAG: hypothetical protein OEZ20_05150 [candidate division WOR-3 bacterium]|nr:hypothetical protein [candidate division WOR-3 bacterium]MDH5683832.1 hypothetical protein [candidate division WOR-3 bacterium]